MLAVALLLSVAALQDYRRAGGTRDWEPILWEFSSVACMTLLVLAVARWAAWLRGRPWPQLLAGHLLGALLFNGLHVGGMFGLRFLVYAWMDVGYDPGPLHELLVYEGAKDLVSYALILMLTRGVWAARAARQRERELAQARTALAEARLSRLAEQVQPHFLFNALNTVIASLIHDRSRRAPMRC